MTHRDIEANGISLHFVEEGQGPAVMFCHGFPAIWSSWKAQMEAVAGGGFMAIAPDMRGYGGSSAPVEPEAYTPYQTMRPALRLRPWLATTSALTWQPGSPGFLDKLRAAGKSRSYWFDMMTAESDQAWVNAAVSVPGMMYWTSGEAPAASRWNPFDPSRGLLRPVPAFAGAKIRQPSMFLAGTLDGLDLVALKRGVQ